MKCYIRVLYSLFRFSAARATSFKFLGSVRTDEGSKPEILSRMLSGLSRPLSRSLPASGVQWTVQVAGCSRRQLQAVLQSRSSSRLRSDQLPRPTGSRFFLRSSPKVQHAQHSLLRVRRTSSVWQWCHVDCYSCWQEDEERRLVWYRTVSPGVSDFVMDAYLALIAVADRMYRGH